jgi:hypothetical protein
VDTLRFSHTTSYMDTQGKPRKDTPIAVWGRAPPGAATRVHMGMSMESPQLLHLRIAVEDMRTIVECSPQLGHTEESSKRCRQ